MSKCRRLKHGGRPKAFWGALVGGLMSFATQAYAANKQAKLQQQMIDRQNQLQREANEISQQQSLANTLNNYANIENEEDYRSDNYGLKYKKGGKRKLRNAAIITDGGTAIPINNGAFLLRGSSHNQVNESGQTGIGINVDGKEVEAEGGEVVRPVNNKLYIYSKQPMLAGGESPAEAVIRGDNPSKVFKAQERAKRHLSSPVEKNRPKAEWGLDVTGGDWIGLGTDLLGSIGVNLFKNRALNNIKYNYVLPEYTDESAVSFDTRYRNGAQRANVERNRINTRNAISKNTASSAVALGRMGKTDTDAMYQLNELWDTKANKEAELRNAAATNEQQVRARNAAARNQWYQNVATIRNQQIDRENELAQAKGSAFAASLSGLSQAASNFLTQAGQRYQDNNALAAMIAGTENGTFARFLANGGRATPRLVAQAYRAEANRDFIAPNRDDYYDKEGNFLQSDYNSALSDYNKRTRESQERLDSYLSYLTPKQQKKYKLGYW